MVYDLVQFAKKLGHDAGKIALRYQEEGFKVESKGALHNLVTEADKAVEHFLISNIQRHYPGHHIVSEEAGLLPGAEDCEFKWIMDPIDGTSNFANGIPLYAVSIAVVRRGKPVVGVVQCPGTNEFFWAQEGQGAYLGSKKIQVSSVSSVPEATLAMGFPYDRAGDAFVHSQALASKAVKEARGFRELGSAAMNLAYLAAGRFDAFYHYDLEPWDIAAGKIILDEAGGRITNMDGSKLNPAEKNLLATNGILHEAMLEFVK